MITDIGFTRIVVGIGRAIIHGAGRHFIMAVGVQMRASAGFGYRTMCGDRRG